MSVTPARRILRAFFIVGLGLVFAALFVVPASAESTTYLRLAHLSPDAPAVDVYVASVADPTNASVVLRGVDYGTLSEYQVVPSGPYIVSMRPAGAEASTPAVIATTLDAETGSAYTVAGVGSFADLRLDVLTDDLTLPPGGQGRVRVIQAAASEAEVDVSLDDGKNLGRDVGFATTTDYSNVPAAEWVLRVTVGDDTLAEAPFTVDPGAVYSVLILDTPTGLAVVTQVDALATAVVPEDGVETGGGGRSTSSPTWTSAVSPPIAVGLGLTGLVLIGFGTTAMAGRRKS